MIPGDRALLVVAADHAEDIVEPALGQHRIGRGIRDQEDAGPGMHLRGGDCRPRAGVTGDEYDAHSDELVGGRDRLLAIAIVVGRDHLDLLAEHAARGIQVGHCELHAALGLFAEPCVRSGERPGQADQDLGVTDRGGAECRRKGDHQRWEKHGLVPPGRSAVTIGRS
jgi:hypothetical protein